MALLASRVRCSSVLRSPCTSFASALLLTSPLSLLQWGVISQRGYVNSFKSRDLFTRNLPLLQLLLEVFHMLRSGYVALHILVDLLIFLLF